MLRTPRNLFAMLLALVLVGGAAIPASAVTRVEGSSRAATAVEVSERWFDRSNAVVVARDDSFADALAGAPLAGRLGAPVLFVESDRVSSEVRDEIARLGAKKVIVLGGPEAVSDAVVRSLGGSRIAAGDRWGTAARVAAAVAGSNGADHVYLVTGTSFPDAVAVAGLAAARRTPILLTATESLPQATIDALRSLGTKRVTVVGGPVAVWDRVLNQVRDMGIDVDRLAGGTRYDTSAAVVQASVDAGIRSTHRIVVSGEGFSDALAAGPAAGATNRVLALNPPTRVGPAALAANGGCDIRQVDVVGNTAAISAHVEGRLQAAEAGDCSGDTPPTGPWRATNGERTLDALMGDSRAAARRGNLSRADDLDRIAYDWSVEQGRRNSMGHNPNLGSQACCYRTVAENVGYYRTGGSAIAPADVDAIVRSIHDQWMGSSGHRANILDTRWHDVGFGVHVQGSALWVTAVYRERNDR